MMIKRSLAVALMGLGINTAGYNLASAAVASIPGVNAPLANTINGLLTPIGSNACWWDVPVLGAGVAFFELLRDDEFDYHCSRDFHGQRDYQRTYDNNYRCEGSGCRPANRPGRRARNAPAG